MGPGKKAFVIQSLESGEVLAHDVKHVIRVTEESCGLGLSRHPMRLSMEPA